MGGGEQVAYFWYERVKQSDQCNFFKLLIIAGVDEELVHEELESAVLKLHGT